MAHKVIIEQWHGDTIELTATRMVASDGAYAFDTEEGPQLIPARDVRRLTTQLIEEVQADIDAALND